MDKGVRSVKLNWSHGSDNHSPISKYTVQYREIRTTEDWQDAVTCKYFSVGSENVYMDKNNEQGFIHLVGLVGQVLG